LMFKRSHDSPMYVDSQSSWKYKKGDWVDRFLLNRLHQRPTNYNHQVQHYLHSAFLKLPPPYTYKCTLARFDLTTYSSAGRRCHYVDELKEMTGAYVCR
jgi:hypothetical protein